MVADITLPFNNTATTAMRYRVYYASHHGWSMPGQALRSLTDIEGRLRGDVILFRRAAIHESVLVNMRMGDDIRAIAAVTRCVTIT